MRWLKIALWLILFCGVAQAQFLVRNSPTFTGTAASLVLRTQQYDQYNVTLTANTPILFDTSTIPSSANVFFRVKLCENGVGGWTPTFGATAGTVNNLQTTNIGATTANYCEIQYWTWQPSINQVVLETSSRIVSGSGPVTGITVNGWLNIAAFTGADFCAQFNSAVAFAQANNLHSIYGQPGSYTISTTCNVPLNTTSTNGSLDIWLYGVVLTSTGITTEFQVSQGGNTNRTTVYGLKINDKGNSTILYPFNFAGVAQASCIDCQVVADGSTTASGYTYFHVGNRVPGIDATFSQSFNLERFTATNVTNATTVNCGVTLDAADQGTITRSSIYNDTYGICLTSDPGSAGPSARLPSKLSISENDIEGFTTSAIYLNPGSNASSRPFAGMEVRANRADKNNANSINSESMITISAGLVAGYVHPIVLASNYLVGLGQSINNLSSVTPWLYSPSDDSNGGTSVGTLGYPGPTTTNGATVDNLSLTNGINGSLALLQLPAPANALTTKGATGATQYCYRSTAVDGLGVQGLLSTERCVSNGNAALSSSNYEEYRVNGSSSRPCGWIVYGRTTGAELKMVPGTKTCGGVQVTMLASDTGDSVGPVFDDIGTITPSGALPSIANTGSTPLSVLYGGTACPQGKGPFTFSQVPACTAALFGSTCSITDSATGVTGTIEVGGGSVTAQLWCSGTSWYDNGTSVMSGGGSASLNGYTGLLNITPTPQTNGLSQLTNTNFVSGLDPKAFGASESTATTTISSISGAHWTVSAWDEAALQGVYAPHAANATAALGGVNLANIAVPAPTVQYGNCDEGVSTAGSYITASNSDNDIGLFYQANFERLGNQSSNTAIGSYAYSGGGGGTTATYSYYNSTNVYEPMRACYALHTPSVATTNTVSVKAVLLDGQNANSQWAGGMTAASAAGTLANVNWTFPTATNPALITEVLPLYNGSGAGTLNALIQPSDTTAYPAWVTATPYKVGEIRSTVTNTPPNGLATGALMRVASIAGTGTSGGTEPNWNANCRHDLDYCLDGTGTVTSTSCTPTANSICWQNIGHGPLYVVTTAGTPSAEPTFGNIATDVPAGCAKIGNTCTDGGGVVYTNIGVVGGDAVSVGPMGWAFYEAVCAGNNCAVGPYFLQSIVWGNEQQVHFGASAAYAGYGSVDWGSPTQGAENIPALPPATALNDDFYSTIAASPAPTSTTFTTVDTPSSAAAGTVYHDDRPAMVSLQNYCIANFSGNHGCKVTLGAATMRLSTFSSSTTLALQGQSSNTSTILMFGTTGQAGTTTTGGQWSNLSGGDLATSNIAFSSDNSGGSAIIHYTGHFNIFDIRTTRFSSTFPMHHAFMWGGGGGTFQASFSSTSSFQNDISCSNCNGVKISNPSTLYQGFPGVLLYNAVEYCGAGQGPWELNGVVYEDTWNAVGNCEPDMGYLQGGNIVNSYVGDFSTVHITGNNFANITNGLNTGTINPQGTIFTINDQNTVTIGAGLGLVSSGPGTLITGVWCQSLITGANCKVEGTDFNGTGASGIVSDAPIDIKNVQINAPLAPVANWPWSGIDIIVDFAGSSITNPKLSAPATGTGLQIGYGSNTTTRPCTSTDSFTLSYSASRVSGVLGTLLNLCTNSNGVSASLNVIPGMQRGSREETKFNNHNNIIDVLNYGTLGSYATTTVSGTVNQPATAFPLVSVSNLATNRWISIAGAGPACGDNWNHVLPNPNYTCKQLTSLSLATVGTPGTTHWDYQASEWDGNGGLGPDLGAMTTITTGPSVITPGTAIIKATIAYPSASVPGAVLWRAPSTPGGQWVLVAFCGHQICRDEGTVRTVVDGVTNGTTTLTSATASFTSMDVNKPVYCVDASNNPIDSVTNDKISSVSNGTTVILASAATGSHSGLTCHINEITDLAISNTPSTLGQNDNLRTRITSISGNTVNVVDASSVNAVNSNVWTDDAGMIQKAINDATAVTNGPDFGPHIIEMPCLQATQNPSGNTCQYREGSSPVTGPDTLNVLFRCTGGGFDERTNGPALWVGGSLLNTDDVQVWNFQNCNVQGQGAAVPASGAYSPLQDGVWLWGAQGVTFGGPFTINQIPHDGFIADKPTTNGGFSTKVNLDVRVRNTGYHGFQLGWGHTMDDFNCTPYCFESAAGQQVSGGSVGQIATNQWNAAQPEGYVEAIGALASTAQGYYVHNFMQFVDGGTFGFHEEDGGNVNGGQGIRLDTDDALHLTGNTIVEACAACTLTDGIFFAGSLNNNIVISGTACDGSGSHTVTNCVNINNTAGNPTVLGTTFNGTAPPALVANIPAGANVTTNGGMTMGQFGFNIYYSAAGTAIPACAASYARQFACVSDSTACTSGTTYTSGGATACLLQCNTAGSAWKETGTNCF